MVNINSNGGKETRRYPCILTGGRHSSSPVVCAIYRGIQQCWATWSDLGVDFGQWMLRPKPVAGFCNTLSDFQSTDVHSDSKTSATNWSGCNLGKLVGFE